MFKGRTICTHKVNLSVYPAPSSSNESIELYVPPPENNNTNNNTCTQLIGANIDKIIGQAPNQWGILIESPTEKSRQNENRQIWKKIDIRKNVLKRGEVEGGDLTFLAWSSMVSDVVCVQFNP